MHLMHSKLKIDVDEEKTKLHSTAARSGGLVTASAPDSLSMIERRKVGERTGEGLLAPLTPNGLNQVCTYFNLYRLIFEHHTLINNV